MFHFEEVWTEISQANCLNIRLKDKSSAYRRPMRTRFNVPFPSQSNFALKNRKPEPQWLRWQGREAQNRVSVSTEALTGPPLLTMNVPNSSSGHSSCGSDGGVHVSFHTGRKDVLPGLLYNWKGCLLHFPWQSRIPLHSWISQCKGLWNYSQGCKTCCQALVFSGGGHKALRQGPVMWKVGLIAVY